MNGDGTASYSANLAATDTLAHGELGIDSFTYWVSDGRDDQAQINIHVNGLNDPPHVVDAIAKKKYTEGRGETIIIDNSLTITDLDDITIEGAIVSSQAAISRQKMFWASATQRPSRGVGIVHQASYH